MRAAGQAFLVAATAAALSLSGPRDWLVGAMLFQPSADVGFPPDALGVRVDEVRLRTSDDVEIHAYDVAPERTDRAILFLHGNAGNASHRLPNAALLAGFGVRVLLLDYRGYGKSAGRPTIPGVIRDARAGLDYLAATGTPPERTVIFGRSLGGAVALQVARGEPLAAVIVESTFSSLADVARTVLGPPAAWIAGDRLDSRAAVAELSAPLLMLHGDADRIVPIALGRDLYAAAPDPRRFEVIPGAGHNDTVEVGGRRYVELLRAFVDEALPPRAGDAAPDVQESAP